MKAITLFACFVLAYADPEQQTPASGWSLTANTVVGVNQPVNLTCHGSGKYSDPLTAWKKNGRDIQLDGKKTDHRLSNDGIDMYLYIKNTTLDDTAAYECTANNRSGPTISIRLQNLTVTKTPAVTVEVLKDSDEIVLRWTVNITNPGPEFYKIERTTENDTYLDPEQINKAESEKIINVPKTQTAYRFRIHAFVGNETHISPYSDWINTAPEKKYKYVPKFEVTNTTENLIELTWKGPSEEDKDEVDNYKIKVDNDTYEQISKEPGTDIIYLLPNRTCGINYTIDVATCSHERSPNACSIWSGEQTVRTKECKNTDSAASFQQQANGILVIMIGLCFLNKYHA